MHTKTPTRAQPPTQPQTQKLTWTHTQTNSPNTQAHKYIHKCVHVKISKCTHTRKKTFTFMHWVGGQTPVFHASRSSYSPVNRGQKIVAQIMQEIYHPRLPMLSPTKEARVLNASFINDTCLCLCFYASLYRYTYFLYIYQDTCTYPITIILIFSDFEKTQINIKSYQH